ncbi:MAG TPA: hypothetical protein VFM51_10000 [Solirubrobacterales bacterium]|nr:hypothetical protein [Solirubrobacterales bacterium]
MDEPSAYQFPNGTFGGVVGIVQLWVCVENERQLAERQASRMFIEEDREDRVLGSCVLRCEVAGIGALCATIRRVLISHEEFRLLVVRPSVGVRAPAGGCFAFQARM